MTLMERRRALMGEKKQEPAPLYEIPDFAEKTVNIYETPVYISKTDGVYHVRTKTERVIYIWPDGTVRSNRPTTQWFSTNAGSILDSQVKNISWVNGNSAPIQMQVKLSQSNADGNLATASFQSAAYSSGSGESAAFHSDNYSSRSIGGIVVQFLKSAGTGTLPHENEFSFEHRLYVNGIRYL